MSLIRNGTRGKFLGVVFSALLTLALFDYAAAAPGPTASGSSPPTPCIQAPGSSKSAAVKQIELTDKHIQGFMAAYEDMAKGGDEEDMAKVDDEELDPEAWHAAIAKKNGFASFAEYDDVSENISMIVCGTEPQTKKFTEPPEQIREKISGLKANKSVPEATKNWHLAMLEAALENAKPIQFKENIALVLKYFDKLAPLIDYCAALP